MLRRFENCTTRVGRIFFSTGDVEVQHAYGDNDPLDVLEVGEGPLQLGQVVPVRALGSLALIDQGELDWKILGIRASDPRSEMDVRDIQDIEELFPKVMSGIREWLRWYKLPEGKPLNHFAYEEEWLPLHETCKVIAEGHVQWVSLLDRLNRHSNEDTEKLWVPRPKDDHNVSQNTTMFRKKW